MTAATDPVAAPAAVRRAFAAARVALEVGDPDEAIIAAESLVAEDPTRVEAHELLLRALSAAGRTSDARAAARRWARSIDGSDTAAHHRIGVVATEAKDTTIAIEAFRRVLAIDPTHADALHRLGRLLERDHREEDGALAISLARRFDHRLASELDREATEHRRAYEAAAVANGAGPGELSGSPIGGYLAVLFGGLGFMGRALRAGRDSGGRGPILVLFALLVVGGLAWSIVAPIRERRRAAARLLQLDDQLVAIHQAVEAGRAPAADRAGFEKLLA